MLIYYLLIIIIIKFVFFLMILIQISNVLIVQYKQLYSLKLKNDLLSLYYYFILINFIRYISIELDFYLKFIYIELN